MSDSALLTDPYNLNLPSLGRLSVERALHLIKSCSHAREDIGESTGKTLAARRDSQEKDKLHYLDGYYSIIGEKTGGIQSASHQWNPLLRSETQELLLCKDSSTMSKILAKRDGCDSNAVQKDYPMPCQCSLLTSWSTNFQCIELSKIIIY